MISMDKDNAIKWKELIDKLETLEGKDFQNVA